MEVVSDSTPNTLPRLSGGLSRSVSEQDVTDLLHRVSSLEQSVQMLLSDKKRVNSQQHLLHMEQQLETCSSPRLRGPYPSVSTFQSASSFVFQMPLHYPRYKKEDYLSMPEWMLDRLLEEYGLPIPASLSQKRDLAIGTFLWK